MSTKIKVQLEVLNSLSNAYQRIGQEVSESSKAANAQINKELEPILRKYSSYSSVTSKVYELQNKLSSAVRKSREFNDRSNDISKNLRKAVDMYIDQNKREQELINQMNKISLSTASSTVSNNIFKNIGKAFENVGDFIKDGADAISDTVSSVIDGIGKKVGSVFSSIKSTVSNAVDSVKVTIGEFKDKAVDTVVKIGQGIKDKIDGVVEGITGFLKKTKDALSDLYGKFKESIMALYESIAKKTQELVDSILKNKDEILNNLRKVGLIIAPHVIYKVDDIISLINDLDLKNLKPEDITREIIETLVANPIFVFATQHPHLTEFLTGVNVSALFYAGGFVMDDNGIYHARQEWSIQSIPIAGYNDFYDTVFHYATDMRKAPFEFTYNGKDYVLWAWRGDYLNLGAGAELGIYTRMVVDGKETDHWLVDQDLAMPMTLTLYYKGEEIISYDPKRDDPKIFDPLRQSTDKWWVTGFNPDYQDVAASDLTAKYTVDFSDNKEMFMEFYKTWNGVEDADGNKWQFDTVNYTATLIFEDRKDSNG